MYARIHTYVCTLCIRIRTHVHIYMTVPVTLSNVEIKVAIHLVPIYQWYSITYTCVTVCLNSSNLPDIGMGGVEV